MLRERRDGGGGEQATLRERVDQESRGAGEGNGNKDRIMRNEARLGQVAGIA
jgi:hypothetical protein